MSHVTEYTAKEGVEIGFEFYVPDDWYGKNYYYYLHIEDATKKTEVKKQYATLLRKYLKLFNVDVEPDQLKILKKGDTQTTHILHVGPSFYLNRRKLNQEKFDEFCKLEKDRLARNRQFNLNVTFKEHFEYHNFRLF